jgi:hypothetical protein
MLRQLTQHSTAADRKWLADAATNMLAIIMKKNAN